MKFDLHLHCNRSFDSISRPEAIISKAKSENLTGLAITDHELAGSEELARIAFNQGIWLIQGSEISTDVGDIVALFIDSKPFKKNKAEDLIDEIHMRGGLAVLAHPFKYIHNYPEHILAKLDAVEIVNSRWADISKIQNDERIMKMLSIVKGRTAGSDAHFVFEIGRAYWSTEVLCSLGELKESIRNGYGYAVGRLTSDWLDELSQCVRFIKNPNIKQFTRIIYRVLRKALRNYLTADSRFIKTVK